MPGNFLASSGPPELLLHILNYSESPQDVLSFALTCRFMADVWHANDAGHAAVWRLLLRNVPFAEEALTVVRANKLVVDAELRGELPPKTMKLPPAGANAQARPSASELTAVRRMAHYVDALTLYCEQGDFSYPYGSCSDAPEEPDRMAEWRIGVQRAIYRALIVTAALVGVYSEPLFTAHRSDDEALRTGIGEPELYLESQKQLLEFLHGFPIYKLRSTGEDQDQLFGSLAQWLLEHILADTASREAMEMRFQEGCGRAIECRLRGDCPLASPDGKRSHSDAHLVALEIMRVLWMCENISLAVGGRNFNLYAPVKIWKMGLLPVFGTFSLRSIECLATGHHGAQFVSKRCPPELNYKTNGAYTGKIIKDTFYKRSIKDVLESVHANAGEPNRFVSSQEETAPLRFKFFEYCLREQVGATFFDEFFVEEDGGEITNNLEMYLRSGLLFSLDDVEGRGRGQEEDSSPNFGSGYFDMTDFLDGTEVLVSASPGPNLYYG